ncbi:MAG: DEAD/DEAH box helicase [bacterium]|nr:DEAD/DEAH box helicase [bacterium]
MYTIKDFSPRLYQQTILNTAVRANTLICLPTGRGKTKTALLVAIHRLNNFPNSKIIFLTPTKPLAAQIAQEFRDCSTIPVIHTFTGEMKPEERERLFKEAQVVVSTPQGMSNDIINRKIDLKLVSAIIFDECQHAVQNYDYVWIAKQYHKVSPYPRILALSASPGSDLEKITEVCQNLFIEDIEVRSDDDPDLKPYVQETVVDYVLLELPKEFKEARDCLQICYKKKLKLLKELGATDSVMQASKTQLLGMQKDMQKRLAQGERDSEVWQSLSLIAEAMKVQFAQELFETQGVSAAYEYIQRLYQEAEVTKVKATKNLVIDQDFKTAYYKITQLFEKKVEHPKFTKLLSLVEEESKKCKKILIFNNFRDSALKLKNNLNLISGVTCELFVGQAKKKGLGMSQKMQIQMLEDFKAEKFNVIIGTSVGEEGIDIPSVDLIIFYEPVPSAIRTVQRRGRTGRMEKGRVIVLVTKGTRDEAYRWTAHHKENRMHRVLKELKNKFTLQKKPEQQSLQEFSKSLKIYADAREKGSGVIKYLVDQGVDIRMQNLDVGDFIVSEKVGVERKEIKDFVDSILDKRLLHQVKALKETFEKPLLIIEGTDDLYSVRKVHPNAIRGMLAWIAIDMKVPIIYTKDFRDTAELLIILARREQEERDGDFSIRGEKKPLSTKELQEFIIAGLPGVGTHLAQNLLKEFGSVHNIINASEEELKDVENIGKKKATEIRRIIDEEYKEKD